MAGFTNEVALCTNIQTDGNPVGTGSFTANGQLLIGGDANPHMAVGTLTAGDNITITNSQNGITIAASGGGLSTVIEDASVANAADLTSYVFVSPGGALTIGLPTVAPVGFQFRISLDGATSIQLTQAAGQQVRFGSSETTLGATGSLTSTAQGDSLTLECVVEDERFIVTSAIGNWTGA